MKIKSLALFLSAHEAKRLHLFLIIIVCLITVDIFWSTIGNSLLHHQAFYISILIEVLIFFTTISIGFELAQTYAKEKKEEKIKIQAINDLKRGLDESKKINKNLKTNYHQKISNHLSKEWSLTKSETEIAMSILKGEAYKEIARSRFTSEKTIRNQAQSIYSKSNLRGRRELSAFFLRNILE